MKIKDLMVPLEDYAYVSQESTIREAVLSLENAQRKYNKGLYNHRAILVMDENKRVVGKLSQNDVIRSLEPGYEHIGNFDNISFTGYSGDFIRSMMKSQGLWQKPLDQKCRIAAERKVKEIMYTPAEGEYVDLSAGIDEAIHQFVIGAHQSLLVTKSKHVVGVLRLTDVFYEICKLIKKCET